MVEYELKLGLQVKAFTCVCNKMWTRACGKKKGGHATSLGPGARDWFYRIHELTI